MASDQVHEMVADGDVAGLVRAGLNAHVAATEGQFCECDDPVISGDRLICGGCLLSHKGQRDAREAAMKEPHPFRWSPLDKEKHEARLDKYGPDADRLKMCRFCGGWASDSRHEGQGEEMWGLSA